MTRRLLARVGAGLLTVALASFMPLAADAAPKPKPPKTPQTYVALGDSYAAGTGAGSYLADGAGCYRSSKGYPVVLAANNNLALDLQACSGATIADVGTLQLGTLTSTTRYVTLTVGGNDVGFADTLTTCLGTDTAGCLAKVAAAEDLIAGDLPVNLTSLFASVKAKAGSATIVATSYPRLFNGSDCSLWTTFTSAEMAAMNTAADNLAAAIQTAAVSAGIGYSDVRTPFVGHAVCDSTPWIYNVDLFAQYNSFHPNATGYGSGYQPAVKASLGLGGGGGGGKGKPKVTTGATTSTDVQRGQVRAQG